MILPIAGCWFGPARYLGWRPSTACAPPVSPHVGVRLGPNGLVLRHLHPVDDRAHRRGLGGAADREEHQPGSGDPAEAALGGQCFYRAQFAGGAQVPKGPRAHSPADVRATLRAGRPAGVWRGDDLDPGPRSHVDRAGVRRHLARTVYEMLAGFHPPC